MHKTIIITGASRGIGSATALAAGRAGFAVCVNYRRCARQAQEVVAQIVAAGGRATAVQADVGSEEDVVRLFAAAEQQMGPLAALVNNAGVTGGTARLNEVSCAQIEQTLRTNVLGSMLCTREAVRRMIIHGGGGAIVNVSSTAARTGGSHEWVHYATSKGAVEAFTLGAAREVAALKIRINAVAPGLVLTDLHADNGLPDRPQRLRDTIPLQRLGEPMEIAHAILWLLSEQASYVTGAVLTVGGGR